MPLIFRGPAMLTPTKGSVRFTAYPADEIGARVIICQITRSALEILAGSQGMTSEAMLGVFNSNISAIRVAASHLFDGGHEEPYINEISLGGSKTSP